MTETMGEWNVLWYETIDHPLSESELQLLCAEIGMTPFGGASADDEWVLAYRIEDPGQWQGVSILYLTRRLNRAGVRFDMKSQGLPTSVTERLHSDVKRLIIVFTQARATRKIPAVGSISSRWQQVQTLMVDFAEVLSRLESAELASARGYVTNQIGLSTSGLMETGFGDQVRLELVQNHRDHTLDLSVALIQPSVVPARLRVEIGEASFGARFTKMGIATIRGIEVSEKTDLLHLAIDRAR